MVGGKFGIQGLEGACYSGNNFYDITYRRCGVNFDPVLLVEK